MKRILSILNIRPGEERNVFLMLAQYFFMGAAMLFVQSASLALFFTAWDSSAMPYIYIGIAVIVSSITAAFLKISSKTSLARFLTLSILFVLAGSIALRIALALNASKWLFLILPIWSQTLVNITVTSFWTLAGNIFDVRQGKRIFGLMNAGSWLAYVVMGPIASPLVAALGAENLYIIISFCLLIAFALQQTVLRANPGVNAPPAETLDNADKNESIFYILKNKYVVLIFALIAFWRISYFILDNIFYDRAALQHPTANELAGFIGGFFGWVGLLGFITDMFLTGRIISRFGLRAGLLATPLATALCIAAFAATGAYAPELTLALFWLSVAGKFSNEGLGFSLDQTASNVLYQPISEKDRVRAQTITEGIIQPLAIGLAGGLLLLFNTVLKFNAIQLSYVYLISAAIWVWVCLKLIRSYPAALTQALHKRRFGDKGIFLADLSSRELVFKALDSPHPNEVLYALDLLEKSGDNALEDIYIKLLQSPLPEVRTESLRKIERMKMTRALPVVDSLIQNDPDPEFRERGARTAVILGFHANRSPKLPEASDPFIQRGVWIGRLSILGITERSEDRSRLEKLIYSENTQDRVEAAKIIYEAGNPNLYVCLLSLLDDADIAVKREALRAAGRVRREEIYPAVIRALGSPQTRSLAFNALVSGKEISLPSILSALQDNNLHRRIHLRLIRACSQIKGVNAIQVLEGLINCKNVSLRSRALSALEDCGYVPHEEKILMVEDQVRAEGRRAVWLLESLSDLGKSEKFEALLRAFEHDLVETRNRLFLLFGFLYDRKTVRRARSAIIRKDANLRSYAVEAMDSILSEPHKVIFIPLLEDFSPIERLGKMGAKFNELSRAGRVTDALANPLALENPWIVATALEFAKNFGIIGTSDVIQNLTNSKESLIARMALNATKENTMLSSVERVLILKSLRIFAETPDEALAELADLLKVIEARAGETIVTEGETGESLYVIVYGKVEVVDDNRVINQLGERDVFGELSLLDSSPRSATVRALEDTTLLRLDQAPFYEIMGDYVEVAIGTIHMLTRNLRKRTGDVLELSRMLGQ